MERRRSKRGKAGHPLIDSVEPVMFGVIRLVFDDGYEAVLDLRPLMTRTIWKNVRTKEDFFAVEIEEYGHHLSWPAGNGLAELPADGLRRNCEHQEKLHASMYE
jgi:hypothetical protein